MADKKSTLLAKTSRKTAIEIIPATPKTLPGILKKLNAMQQAWAKAQGFDAAPGSYVCLPDDKGKVAKLLYGLDDAATADPFAPCKLATSLPAGTYALADGFNAPELIAIGWVLQQYKFTRYLKKSGKSDAKGSACLVCPAGCDYDALKSQIEAVELGRDLINTPAEDMGPSQLESAVKALSKRHKAKVAITKGAKLEKDFPLIHAVGRAADDAPRLIDMTWGPSRAPRITLVGKGVCFDTGGLDLKTAAGMLLMKKDMGGAAAVLSLAHMIMAAKLNVRLRVLIPAVENSVSGNAFRPGDIIKSRKGISVEIGNTDAEGRLVLADALALADEEQPDMLIDMATLTGAARVALGPDLPPFYTDDNKLAADLTAHSMTTNDQVWHMPFWHRYNDMLSSSIADVNNVGKGGFAGSITAALFLKKFVEKAKAYIHLDIYGWVPAARPARPAGGEPNAARALFSLIAERYPARK